MRIRDLESFWPRIGDLGWKNSDPVSGTKSGSRTASEFFTFLVYSISVPLRQSHPYEVFNVVVDWKVETRYFRKFCSAPFQGRIWSWIRIRNNSQAGSGSEKNHSGSATKGLRDLPARNPLAVVDLDSSLLARRVLAPAQRRHDLRVYDLVLPFTSVGYPWHFGTDQDPRIRISD